MKRTTDSRHQSEQSRETPTRKQIRDRCRKIQKEWSESTRRRRSGQPEKQWTVPVTRAATSSASAHLEV